MKSTVVKKACARIWRTELTESFRTSRGRHDFLENVLFCLELKNGIVGYGEAAVATHLTGETVPQTLATLKQAALDVTGRDITDYLSIAREFSDGFTGNRSAQAAFEMALLDALTQRWKIPLWKFFGEKPNLLKTDMTVVLGNVEEAVESAKKIKRQGIRSLKIKIGKNPEEDFERVVRVAKIARGSKIFLDANQGFTAPGILNFLKRLGHSSVRPELIEQPVQKDDWEGLRDVTRHAKILVIADESASSLADAVRIIQGGFAGGLNIKLMKFGIFAAREAAALAHSCGFRLMIGQMMETPLATTAAAHLAAGMGCFDYTDLDTPFFIRRKVTRGCFWSPNGAYDLREIKAGIGVRPIPS